MLKRYAHRLAVLEARFIPRPGMAAGGPGLAQAGRSAAGRDDAEGPEGPDPGVDGQGDGKRASVLRQDGRSPDDETKDLTAEVEALERRRQELEAEIGETA